MVQDMKVDLSGVPETLLMALWGRAKVSKEDNPVLKDSKAIKIVESLIEYDFEKSDKHLPHNPPFSIFSIFLSTGVKEIGSLLLSAL